MSSGNVPRSSGDGWIYYLLAVGAVGAAGFYGYTIARSNQAKYMERMEHIQQTSAAEWKPKPWPPPVNEALENEETETKEVTDTNEEAEDAAVEETGGVIAGESPVQNEELAEESAESEKGEESPVEEATSGMPAGEQDASANSEASQDPS